VTEAFISIGSNIRPAENVRQAIHLLARQVRITGISTVYRTPAEGRPEQPAYYNCVVRIETDLPAGELKHRVLRGIERDLGRQRGSDKFAPRTIDLDLILCGQLAIEEGDLRLPDAQILIRPFLAIPLYELAPQLTLPGAGVPIKNIAAALADNSHDGMAPLAEYTESVRNEILPQR
jgi:2-amino-4-hydroxy-6-hydroxymethyldihydropteridine diphosphokinase